MVTAPFGDKVQSHSGGEIEPSRIEDQNFRKYADRSYEVAFGSGDFKTLEELLEDINTFIDRIRNHLRELQSMPNKSSILGDAIADLSPTLNDILAARMPEDQMDELDVAFSQESAATAAISPIPILDALFPEEEDPSSLTTILTSSSSSPAAPPSTQVISVAQVSSQQRLPAAPHPVDAFHHVYAGKSEDTQTFLLIDLLKISKKGAVERALERMSGEQKTLDQLSAEVKSSAAIYCRVIDVEGEGHSAAAMDMMWKCDENPLFETSTPFLMSPQDRIDRAKTHLRWLFEMILAFIESAEHRVNEHKALVNKHRKCEHVLAVLQQIHKTDTTVVQIPDNQIGVHGKFFDELCADNHGNFGRMWNSVHHLYNNCVDRLHRAELRHQSDELFAAYVCELLASRRRNKTMLTTAKLETGLLLALHDVPKVAIDMLSAMEISCSHSLCVKMIDNIIVRYKRQQLRLIDMQRDNRLTIHLLMFDNYNVLRWLKRKLVDVGFTVENASISVLHKAIVRHSIPPNQQPLETSYDVQQLINMLHRHDEFGWDDALLDSCRDESYHNQSLFNFNIFPSVLAKSSSEHDIKRHLVDEILQALFGVHDREVMVCVDPEILALIFKIGAIERQDNPDRVLKHVIFLPSIFHMRKHLVENIANDRIFMLLFFIPLYVEVLGLQPAKRKQQYVRLIADIRKRIGQYLSSRQQDEDANVTEQQHPSQATRDSKKGSSKSSRGDKSGDSGDKSRKQSGGKMVKLRLSFKEFIDRRKADLMEERQEADDDDANDPEDEPPGIGSIWMR